MKKINAPRPGFKDEPKPVSVRIYGELPPARISMLRFLMESEDHLACVSVLNPWRGTIRISAPAGLYKQVLAFLATIQQATGLKNIKTF